MVYPGEEGVNKGGQGGVKMLETERHFSPYLFCKIGLVRPPLDLPVSRFEIQMALCESKAAHHSIITL